MAQTQYPFIGGYRNYWHADYKSDPVKMKRYVHNSLSRHPFSDAESCEVGGGKWAQIKLLNTSGQSYFSKDSFIEVCCLVDFLIIPTHIMIGTIGQLSAHKQRSLSFKETMFGLLRSALRTMEVMIPLGSLVGAPQLMESLSSVQKMFEGISDKLKPLLAPLLESYQKSMAWISHEIHFELLKKLSTIGRIIVPAYDEYWIEQENQLANLSMRIFGDTTHVATYIHLAEMMFTDLALKAGKSGDEARYQGMQHGADLMKRLQANIHSYESNPALVWSFIMNETFGEGNPYIKEEAGLSGRDIFIELGALSKAIIDVKTVANRLEMYNTELNKLNLTGMTEKVSELGNTLNTYYDETVRPVIEGIETINEEQTALLERLEKERDEEKRARERSHLFATPSGELSTKEKAQQASHFTDLFSNAVDPSDDVSRQFRQDIETLIGAIYD